MVEFHGLFAGAAPSCLSSELARKLAMSVSSFLLLHGSCSHDGSSRPVCSTACYMAQHFVYMFIGMCSFFTNDKGGGKCVCPITFRIWILQHTNVVVPNQCYDIVMLLSPQWYFTSRLYDSGPSLLSPILIIVRMPELDCFLRQSCGVEQFVAGHSHCINTVYFQKSAQDSSVFAFVSIINLISSSVCCTAPL